MVWREQVRDDFGLPTGQVRARQESYPTREDAEARRDELSAARHTSGTTALADQRKAGELPFGYFDAALARRAGFEGGSRKAQTAHRG